MSEPHAASTPAMLTFAERNHLRALAREAGPGRLVELGTFLGASAECLLEGAGDRLSPSSPLLVYDAFLTTPDMYDLYPMPFQPGESFRELFDLFQRDRLGRMCVREGLVSEDASGAECAALYPEQEPVSLLFVDLAKTEGVHRTLARAFFPHVSQGSLVVQQDFKHPYCSWLPAHMYELREYFTLVEDVPGWTVTFRCESVPTPGALASLSRESDTRLPGEIDELWGRVAEWIRASERETLSAAMGLHCAMHHLRAGHWCDAGRVSQAALESTVPDAFGCGEAAEAMKSNVLFLAGVMESYVRAGAQELVGPASFLREWAGSASPGSDENIRWALWRQVAETLRAQGHRTIALMGGGAHTQRLLEQGWPGGRLEIAAVLDDQPLRVGERHSVEPGDFDGEVDAVVVSSESAEGALAARAHEVFGPRGVPVVTVYEPGLPEAVIGARP